MRENKYDDPVFFEKYSQTNRSKMGLAGAGEWETLRKCLRWPEKKHASRSWNIFAARWKVWSFPRKVLISSSVHLRFITWRIMGGWSGRFTTAETRRQLDVHGRTSRFYRPWVPRLAFGREKRRESVKGAYASRAHAPVIGSPDLFAALQPDFKIVVPRRFFNF